MDVSISIFFILCFGFFAQTKSHSLIHYYWNQFQRDTIAIICKFFIVNDSPCYCVMSALALALCTYFASANVLLYVLLFAPWSYCAIGFGYGYVATVSAMANFTNCINLSVRNRRAFSRIVCTNRAPVKKQQEFIGRENVCSRARRCCCCSLPPSRTEKSK